MAQASKSDPELRLPIHEWFAILLLIGLLFGLTLITLYSKNAILNDDFGPAHHIVSQEIVVYVEGSVEKPGPYYVKRGTLVKEVIDLAKPLPEANLGKLKLDKKVRKNQVIKIKVNKKSSK